MSDAADSAAGLRVPESFGIARRLFATFLGGIVAIAFLSILGQARGLFGERGIQPAGEFLRMVLRQLGGEGLWQVPTLFWIGSSDAAILTVCWLGVIAGVLLALGIAPGAAALVSWGLYLSLCSVGSPFLDFQWDALLLETLLLAAVALPWRLRPDWREETVIQRAGRWLVWWLVFRLMFESGLVKLTWGDKVWLSFSALDYHFETQPIPNAIAWYAHQLPAWLLRAGVFLMFLIEMVCPFLIVCGRRLRHIAALALIALQVAILVTGNFAFFNLLSIAICLPLLADSAFPRRFHSSEEVAAPKVPIPAVRIAAHAILAIGIVLTLPGLISAFRWDFSLGNSIARAMGPWRSFNGYGLFRVMTTERPEIVVEGSQDGVNWHAYQFRWKPGELYRAPVFVAPHQPRLDWQMWFAALGDVRQNPWFVNFLVRVLENSKEVRGLLAGTPFGDTPPRYVRAVLYRYQFTRSSDRTAAWWKREMKGLYCPPISLKQVGDQSSQTQP